jgi:hypothetical protein
MTKNLQPAFASAGSITHDNLLAGDAVPVVTGSVKIAKGQVLPRGAVLGVISTGAASAQAGTNTGNGTMGAITVGSEAKAGDYVLTVTAKAADAGTFTVVDPDGLTVGTGTVGVAFNAGGLSFTLADGATDFEVDDSFTITVTKVPGEYVLSASGATDGSQTIKAILAEDTDATDGPVTTVAYLSGEFNTNALTLGVGHTVASIKDGLRDLNIYLKTNLPA